MATVWVDHAAEEKVPGVIKVGSGLLLVPLGDGVYELRLGTSSNTTTNTQTGTGTGLTATVTNTNTDTATNTQTGTGTGLTGTASASATGGTSTGGTSTGGTGTGGTSTGGTGTGGTATDTRTATNTQTATGAGSSTTPECMTSITEFFDTDEDPLGLSVYDYTLYNNGDSPSTHMEVSGGVVMITGPAYWAGEAAFYNVPACDTDGAVKLDSIAVTDGGGEGAGTNECLHALYARSTDQQWLYNKVGTTDYVRFRYLQGDTRTDGRHTLAECVDGSDSTIAYKDTAGDQGATYVQLDLSGATAVGSTDKNSVNGSTSVAGSQYVNYVAFAMSTGNTNGGTTRASEFYATGWSI